MTTTTRAGAPKKAPANSEAASHSESLAATLRASSAAFLAWTIVSFTRFSASAWLMPVRRATILAT